MHDYTYDLLKLNSEDKYLSAKKYLHFDVVVKYGIFFKFLDFEISLSNRTLLKDFY